MSDSRTPPKLWPVAIAYSVIASALCLLDRPLDYVADNRYEVYESPWRVLARTMSTWDPSRGFGTPRDDVWLATTLPTALLQSFGLSTMLSQRLFHAACLVIFGLGVVVLIRDLRRSLAVESVVAGVLAMLSPFTISFFIPSNLAAMVFLTPWLMIFARRGITGIHPVRNSAAFALVVFIAGNGDTPGLLYSGLSVGVFLAAVIAIERATHWRQVLAWMAGTIALSATVSAWALTKAVHASDALSARLAATELPTASATASSWSESWRGLGNWLSYFVENGKLTKPQTISYFEQPLVIASTFALPVVALAVLWRGAWRGRLVFGGLVLASVVVMAGGFPAPDRSPFGTLLLWAMDNSSALASLRNTYKAGAGLVIGTSALVAIGFVGGVRALWTRSRWAGVIGSAACIALVVGGAWPALSGGLYHPEERLQAIPAHWEEATTFLNDLEPSGRSLIIPSASQAWYRWGYAGDDLFDALLTRSHATATGWLLSTRPAHAAIEALTLATQPPAYRQGVIGPMARRLGITEIVLRNDLDWQRNSVPRPAAYLALRADPDLELVATFGPTGSSLTADPLDTSAEAAYERSLPPVEVYRIRSSIGGALVRQPSSDTVIVAGDAHGWAPLLSSGVVRADTRLVASAAMDDDDLLHALDGGARVVYTDSGRRRVLTLLHHEPQLSQTLSADQVLDRPAWATFADRPGAESVAWFRDALKIEGSAVRLGGNRNDRRPALAFDGDPATAWAIPSTGLAGPTAYVEVHLRRQREVSTIAVQTVLAPNGSPTVRTVEVRLSDDSIRPIRIGGDGRGSVSFPPTTTATVRLSIKDLSTFGREAGLAEVVIDDLDLREYVEVPTDLRRRNAEISDRLELTETGFSFRRVARAALALPPALVSSAFDEESTVNRRFELPAQNSYDLSGAALLTATTSDELVAAAIGSSLTASVPRVPGVISDRVAANLIDGDASTPWTGPARAGTVLTLRFPRQVVRTVRVVIPDDQSTARVTRLTALVDGRNYVAVLQARRCDTAGFCSRTAVFQFPVSTEIAELQLRVAAIDRVAAIEPDVIRIGEVRIGDAPLQLDPAAPLETGCVDIGIAIRTAAGDARVAVRLDGSVDDFLRGRPIPFSGCASVDLPAGAALLTTSPGSPVDELRLIPTTWDSSGANPKPSDARVVWQTTSPDRWTGIVAGDGTIELVTRESFDPQWVLTSGSQRINATELDALSAFTFSARDGETVTLSYEPARVQDLARLLTMTTVWLCLAVIAASLLGVRRRPSAAMPTATTDLQSTDDVLLRPSAAVDRWVFGLSIAAGFAVAGWIGLIVAAATGVMLIRAPHIRLVLGVAPIALLIVAALQTVIAADTVTILYARERWVPSVLARLAVIFAVPSLLGAIAASHRPTHIAPTVGIVRTGVPRWRPSAHLAVVAAAAGVAATTARDLRVDGAEALVASVRQAISYNVLGSSAPPSVRVAPLGVLLTAFLPTPTWLWTSLAAAATVVASAIAVQHRCGHRTFAAATSLVVAAWVAVAHPPASALAASALVLCAFLVMAHHRHPARSTAAAAIAGALIGLAALAQPSALLAAVVIAVLFRRARPALTAVVISLITCSAWIGIVVRHATMGDMGAIAAEMQWAGPVAIVAVITTAAGRWMRFRSRT